MTTRTVNSRVAMNRRRHSDGDTRKGMWAARLHAPSDLRVERVPHPGDPGPGQALIRVKSTGICGSDLHSYQDARIGDTPIEGALVLGHEFSGVVQAVGPGSLDGGFEPLQPGTRVAVDPAQPCGRCEGCEHGHPNLCRRLHFCGNYPDGGSLCEWMHMPARSCFPIPRSMDFETAALLEPLGVALHATDLAKLRIGSSVAILGAGPIGLMILQLARLAGADPVFLTDKLPWRLALGKRWGAVPIRSDREDAVERVLRETAGRGVDVAMEAAWGDGSVGEAAEMARLGGRLVLVGIPSEDRLLMKHSTARRKGLTIALSRRMKHVYPRAIRLAEQGAVDLKGLVTHRFGLRQAPEALALNAAYQDRVVKVMVTS
jgi:L-iditol 2-dehydrogenase